MTPLKKLQIVLLLAAALSPSSLFAQPYLLGPGDQISVNVRDRKELEIKPATIDTDGSIELAYAGRLRAEGLSTEQLAHTIEARLTSVVQNPHVTVQITQYGSQPVSILGAVNRPGVHQLQGQKNLVEVLSLAEGLKNEAGNVINITRPKSSGPIPLPNAKEDPTGEFYTAEVSIKGLLDASAPESNIPIRPRDIVTVPRADLIYVLGNVHRPGGFPLTERASITVLQALAIAEGIAPGAATQSARIIRRSGSSSSPIEVPVDVKKMVAGTLPDQPLLPNDILFIPNSASKAVGMRLLEATVQIATGVVIWGPR